MDPTPLSPHHVERWEPESGLKGELDRMGIDLDVRLCIHEVDRIADVRWRTLLVREV